MTTMKTISAALKLVDVKKENLRKAFEDLQFHTSSLSSFNLSWSDMDSYFTSLQASLETKFKLLQSQETTQSQPADPSPIQRQPSSSVIVNESFESFPVQARPVLKSLCKKMDGVGLRKYMDDRKRERNEIKAELPDALRCAPDAAAMVLDAMKGFYGANSEGDNDQDLGTARRTCVILLEELRGLKPEISVEVKERARTLAAEWKGKVSVAGENPLEALGFLNLLATYGIADGFSVDDLIELFVIVARFQQATELCRLLGFGDRLSDVISKLISKGKQPLAVKFIFEFDEFELTDKFPPVAILKEYVAEAMKLAKKVRKDGKYSIRSQNEASDKEISALKSVIQIIEAHELESEYPKQNLVQRIEALEKQKAERKYWALGSASKPQQQSGSKRPRSPSPAGLAAIPHSIAAPSMSVPAFEQPHLQATVLLPDYPSPYLSSSAGPYSLAGSTPGVTPYAGTYAGFYGTAAGPLGVSGNLMPARPHANPPEAHMPSQPHAYPPEAHMPSQPHAYHPEAHMPSQPHAYPPEAHMPSQPHAYPPEAHMPSQPHAYPPEAHMPSQPHAYPAETRMPSQPHTYPAETHIPSGYFDRPVSYAGYGLAPQYHPSYYPQ